MPQMTKKRHAKATSEVRSFLKRSKLARTRGLDPHDPDNAGVLVQRAVTERKLGNIDEIMKERVRVIRAMSYAGATVDEIAAYFSVNVSTLYITWAREYPDVLEALRAGRENADDRVEKTLYRRAVNGDSDTAAIFWLKNRRPKDWRDKREIDLSGEMDVNTNATGMRDTALALIQLLREAGNEAAGLLIEHEGQDDAEQPAAPQQAPAAPAYTPDRPRRRFA